MDWDTKAFDAADYLTDDESITDFLSDALESNNPRVISKSIAAVARARGGMAHLAQTTDIPVDTLTAALNEAGNPDLSTLLRILSALGVRLTASIAA